MANKGIVCGYPSTFFSEKTMTSTVERTFISSLKGVPAAKFEEHITLFARYAESFIHANTEQSFHQILKRDHTCRVLANAAHLAQREFVDPLLVRALLLAALYHDIGRFEQLKRFGTYADAKSLNHATLALVVAHRLRAFASEDPLVSSLAKVAIAVHNRHTLPDTLGERQRLVANAVRDADKLDILGIMAGMLGPGCRPDPEVAMFLCDESGRYTPKFLQGLQGGPQGKYVDMHYMNDFRLLLAHWAGEMSFPSSRMQLKEQGHIFVIVEGLDDVPEAKAQALAFLARELR